MRLLGRAPDPDDHGGPIIVEGVEWGCQTFESKQQLNDILAQHPLFDPQLRLQLRPQRGDIRDQYRSVLPNDILDVSFATANDDDARLRDRASAR